MGDRSVMLDMTVSDIEEISLEKVEGAISSLLEYARTPYSSMVVVDAVLFGWCESDPHGNLLWRCEFRIRKESLFAYMKVTDEGGAILFEGRMPWFYGEARVSYLFYNIFLGVKDKMYRAQRSSVSERDRYKGGATEIVDDA